MLAAVPALLDLVLRGGDDDLVGRVRDTVVHEIAHHFGISDERLQEMERERKRKR